jgi:hypothetical protein
MMVTASCPRLELTFLAGERRRGKDNTPMLEAVVIIVALGGLELILWLMERRSRAKELELLDAIWTELALRNAVDVPETGSAASDTRPQGAGASTRHDADAPSVVVSKP